MTLISSNRRFFTAKLGDYTLVVSCRKLTNMCSGCIIKRIKYLRFSSREI